MMAGGEPRNARWNRAEQAERVRHRLWQHLPRSATFIEGLRPDAAELFQLPDADLQHLALIHFLVSDEVEAALEAMPLLERRLATTTHSEEETTRERIRGRIEWGKTSAMRAALGDRTVYVTAPARRAFQTPENEMLVFVLDTIVSAGSAVAFSRSHEVGSEAHRRVEQARGWTLKRTIGDIERRPVTPRSAARIRTGRFRRRYAAVLAAYDLFDSLVLSRDRDRLQQMVEEQAIVEATDSALFEVACVFDIIDVLISLDWKMAPLALFGPDRKLHARGVRGDANLELWYQQSPARLATGSLYASVLAAHGDSMSSSSRRPDVTLLLNAPGAPARWVVIESKLGMRRSVHQSARAALADLLSYRRDFSTVLSGAPHPYGIGIAWGLNLAPVDNGEAILCTPDQIGAAIEMVTHDFR